VTGVPVDDQGMIVDANPAGARLVCVTPSHQFPLGMSMSRPRRMALLAWGRAPPGGHPGGRLRQRVPLRRPPHRTAPDPGPGRPGRLYGLVLQDAAGHPAAEVRGGAGVAAPGRPGRQGLTDWHAPLPLQGALARFIQQGLFARHLRKMRAIYRARHGRVVDILTEQFADHLKLIPSAVGLHLAAPAPGASSEELDGLLRRASAAGSSCCPCRCTAWTPHPNPV